MTSEVWPDGPMDLADMDDIPSRSMSNAWIPAEEQIILKILEFVSRTIQLKMQY